MTVRSWFSDPIYFDPQPNAAWVNANELLEAGRKHEVFLADRQTLNLYPILVRRSDFLRRNASDRVLARFPFLRLTVEERDAFSQQELLVAERLRDYFYRSVDRRILEWRSLLHHYLEERGAVPLPFLRCLPAAVPAATSLFSLEGRTFESARGESFTMPSNLTSELAYLCGVINGDGSLTRYVLNIIDYSLAHIRQLRERFSRLFGQTGRIQQQSETSPALIITNLWVVRLVSFLTGQPIGGKKYAALREPLLFRDEPLRSFYWSGVMDADGSYARRNVTLTTASEEFAMNFMTVLQCYNIECTLYKEENGIYQVYIPRKSHHVFKTKFHCFHPEKVIAFQTLREGRAKRPKRPRFFAGFKKETMINNYFDFTLLKGMYVVGLTSFLVEQRGRRTIKAFSKELQLSPGFYHRLETGKSAMALRVLMRLLKLKQEPFLPFLFRHKNTIRYRKHKSLPVFLDLQPNKELLFLAQNMTFYDHSIRLSTVHNEHLVRHAQKHFDINLNDTLIKNGAINEFFTTFCWFIYNKQ